MVTKRNPVCGGASLLGMGVIALLAWHGRAKAQETNRPRTPMSYYQEAIGYERVGEHAEAASVYARGTTAHPDNAPLHAHLARALARAGDPAGAIAAAREAADLEPKTARYWVLLGDVYRDVDASKSDAAYHRSLLVDRVGARAPVPRFPVTTRVPAQAADDERPPVDRGGAQPWTPRGAEDEGWPGAGTGGLVGAAVGATGGMVFLGAACRADIVTCFMYGGAIVPVGAAFVGAVVGSLIGLGFDLAKPSPPDTAVAIAPTRGGVRASFATRF